jgi:hypothetical protein
MRLRGKWCAARGILAPRAGTPPGFELHSGRIQAEVDTRRGMKSVSEPPAN